MKRGRWKRPLSEEKLKIHAEIEIGLDCSLFLRSVNPYSKMYIWEICFGSFKRFLDSKIVSFVLHLPVNSFNLNTVGESIYWIDTSHVWYTTPLSLYLYCCVSNSDKKLCHWWRSITLTSTWYILFTYIWFLSRFEISN